MCLFAEGVCVVNGYNNRVINSRHQNTFYVSVALDYIETIGTSDNSNSIACNNNNNVRPLSPPPPDH